MGSSKRSTLAALVISLAALVISLPAVSSAAVAPDIDPKTIQVITDGIRTPAGIALDADGNIYLTDLILRGVKKFNKFGKEIMTFKTAGLPQRVALTSSGAVLVTQGSFVAAYNNNGFETFRLSQGGQPYPFHCATGIAVHPVTGNIYVADAVDHVVRIFDQTGNYTGNSFGDQYKMAFPVDVMITDEFPGGVRTNRVFVVNNADTGFMIQVYSDQGAFSYSMCQRGIGPYLTNGVYSCALNFPMGLAVEYAGAGTTQTVSRLYASDMYQSTVVSLDPSLVGSGIYGSFLSYIGEYGSHPGDLIVPAGVVFDQANKRLVVANGYGNMTFYPVDGGSNPVNSGNTITPTFTINPLSANNITTPSLTISGTRGTKDMKVNVKVSTGAVADWTLYPSDTTWNCAITGLAEGRNDITAQAADGAGNVLTQSLTVYYIKPALAGFSINSFPSLVASSSYAFTGSMPTGATIATTPASLCTYSADKTTWTCPVPLVEGPNTVTFTVTNGASTGTSTVSITSDTLNPTLQVFGLASGDTTSTQIQNFTGIVGDANLDKVTVAVNNNPPQTVNVSYGAFGFAPTTGTFSVPVTLNAAGANTVTVVAADKIGNSTTNARTINLNMTAPKVTISSPADGKVTRGSSLTASGSVDQAGSTCTINGNAVTMTGTTWTGTAVLTPGFNNLIVACTNGGLTSKAKSTVYSDANSLEIAIMTPAQDLMTNANSVGVQGTVDSLAEKLIATINGTTTTVPITNGSFSFPVDVSTDGIYSYLLTAIDGTGSTVTTATRTIIADHTPPAVTINYGPAGPVTSVSGTVDPGCAVQVTNLSGTAVGTVTLNGANFTANLGGSYDPLSLVVAATDQAGNVTTISAGKPDGDCNADGTIAADDASFCLDIVAGIRTPTPLQIAHCDVGPLKGGMISPSGQIDITDCILSLRRANGLAPVWW